ncbi:MAG: YcaQ family DNA glycosylase [Clostridia bacterium]|nr:YcaQ family DNA glycosylase [Clostridia bacterium]
MVITKAQARRFILLHHGLLGEHRFIGKDGAYAYVRQAGCIQFDPVDVCGKNAELTLQSRVKGMTKEMLHDLLYQDRLLADYTDKQLAIITTEDWPYFARFRAKAVECGRQFAGLAELEAQAKAYIAEHGPVAAEELPIEGKIEWHSAIHWSGNWNGLSNAARSVLEQLYSAGELVIHHKKGSRKVYDLASRHLPQALLDAPDPLEDDRAHICWRVLRRIGAIGLLWNRPSDAWLGIGRLDTQARNEAFAQLLAQGEIFPVEVEGIRGPMYCRERDRQTLALAVSDTALKPRCEAIAPLDPMMWDRKLIRALFGYEYSWEIYTPAEKRKYGYYVLPLLYGEGFAGRVEAARDEKAGVLRVKHIWLEDGVRRTKKLDAAICSCMKRLAKFNACKEVLYDE